LGFRCKKFTKPYLSTNAGIPLKCMFFGFHHFCEVLLVRMAAFSIICPTFCPLRSASVVFHRRHDPDTFAKSCQCVRHAQDKFFTFLQNKKNKNTKKRVIASTLTLVLCFERFWKRAFPKALRLTRSGSEIFRNISFAIL